MVAIGNNINVSSPASPLRASSPIASKAPQGLFMPVTALTIHYAEEMKEAPTDILEAKENFCNNSFTVPPDFKAKGNPFSF